MSRVARLPIFFLVLAAACATPGGKSFKDAERLRTEGQLVEAERAYQQALISEPKQPKYEDRLASLRAQMEQDLERLKSEARAKEKAGDWAGASERYAQALALRPGDQELQARKALSSAKAKNLDPDSWYVEVQAVAQRLGKVTVVERSLAGARANAYQYQLTMAAKLLEAGDAAGALARFERAKEIDPSMPAFDQGRYDEARALDLVAQADLRSTAGDAVGAHELLTQALELKPLPEIKKKLAEAKGRAAVVLRKLDQARAKAAQGRRAEALRLYDELGSMKGAPAVASEEAAKVRKDLAAEAAQEAQRAAARRDLVRARVSLQEALRYAELGPVQLEGVKVAVEAAVAGQPGRARSALEGAALTSLEPLEKAVRGIVRASMEVVLDRAKNLAKKNPGEAITLLSELEAFEQEAPEIAALKSTLRKDAFASLLDDALSAAKAGNDKEAALRLIAALKASSPPQGLVVLLDEALRALTNGQHAEAAAGFQQALAQAPRSQLAQRGLDVVRLRRGALLREAVEGLRSGKGDRAVWVDRLALAAKAEPGNPEAKEAARQLLAHLKADGARLSDAELAQEVSHSARLSSLSSSAQAAVDRGTGALSKAAYADAEAAFKDAEAAQPGAPLLSLARAQAKSRLLSSLSADASAAASRGGEARAKALADLLEADPKNKEARAAIQGALDRASASGKRGEHRQAAEQLSFLVIATRPAPGLKKALDDANAALSSGSAETAERRYTDALDLEGENAIAKAGLTIAKAARVQGLKEAVAKAKEGQGASEAASALKQSLELDPNSPEARQAFKELLDSAEARAAEGKDREAAALLDSANTASKPESAKKAIAAANQLLADGRYQDAVLAFDRVLASGESQVALRGKAIAASRRMQVLLAGVEELRNGGDLERGVKATAQLLAEDAKSPAARVAIDATLDRAAQAAAEGDDKATVKELRAADRASGPTSGFEKALATLERGKFDEAAAAFSALPGDVARRAAEIAQQRKLGSLKAGLSGSDQAAAESVRAILKADPNSKEAKQAFQKLLDRAKAKGKQGDTKDAALALDAATVASGASGELASALKVATGKLGEGRFAEAEAAFLTALEVAPESAVGATGRDVSRDRRRLLEKAALARLKTAEDPREPAQVLKASLIVEPTSGVVRDGRALLLGRAKKAADKAEAGEAARALDAAAELAPLPSETLAKVHEAGSALAAGRLEDAEGLYDAAAEALSGPAKEVVLVGKAATRGCRRQALDQELKSAQKEKDTLRAQAVVEKILAHDPSDKQALLLSKRLGGDAVGERVRAAETQRGFGKLGVAYLYLSRALAIQPTHAEARSALSKLEEQLAGSMDLVAVVQEVGRKATAKGCKGLESLLRQELMTSASTREDLGFWTLGKDYTAAWERGDAGSPKVNGALMIDLSRCESDAAKGKVSLSIRLVTPIKGRTVVEAEAEAELPAGLIPRDEQDPSGANARAALATRAAKAVLQKLEERRSQIDGWQLAAAEQAIDAKDVALAADAWARLKIGGHRADEKRLKAVESFLDHELP